MSRRPLPLNAIPAFLVAARHLNLTHAAQELCITQSAVSRKIATLEAWLGFSLFDRHARGLHLTAQGAALLPELKHGFDHMITATEKVCQSRGAIRLKAPTCVMCWLLPKLVMLEQQHPEIQVALTTTLNHNTQLDNFDVAILYGPPLKNGYTLFDEALTPVVASSLMKTGSLSLEELSNFTFLHPTNTNTDWSLWLRAQQCEIAMRRNQHFDTMDLAISAAIQGFGITVADVTLIQSDLAMKRLVAPFSRTVKTGAAYSLIHRTDTLAPAQLADLVAWLCRL